MVKDIPKGTRLKSSMGIEIVIDEKLGEGGQGQVYKILYGGQPKALKIYKPGKIKNPKAFHNNLVKNIKRGAPSSHFLWPEDILPWNGKTFGYVMDLRPGEFVELVDFMNDKKDVRFANFKAAITAGLEMTNAYRILHSAGLSYQDLSDGNFFINPNTGKVLICDNDNVSEYGENLGILGTPQYMAPEIVRGEAKPSTHTDRFSLAVILFILLTMTHPLEGSRHLCEYLSPANERILYGTDPVFILDPNDRRNAPVKGTHNNIGYIWPALPLYVRQMFTEQFSRQIMMNPQRRATEGDWQNMLIRLRSDTLRCPHCKGELFSHDPKKPVCGNCQKPLGIKGYMKLGGANYSMPLVAGNIVYRSQFGSANIDVAGEPVLKLCSHPQNPGALVIQNISKEALQATKPNGQRVPFEAGKFAACESGLLLEGFGGSVSVL